MTRQSPAVVVLTPTFFPIVGGAEVGIHEIFSRIGERDRVIILTPKETAEGSVFASHEAEVASGYEVIRYSNCFMRWRKGPVRSLMVSLAIPELMQLWKLRRQGRLDVLNIHFARPFGLAALWARWFLGVNTVLSLIGRTDVWHDAGHGSRLHLRLAVRYSKRVVAITQFCVEGSPIAKSTLIIPYGVDLDLYEPSARDEELRLSWGGGERDVVVFCAQRLALVKRVDQVLAVAEALKSAVTANGGRFIFVIAGRGEEWDALKKLVVQHGLHNVRLLGFVPESEMPRHFASADIFVSHSMYETFGVMFAQAMASGVPIVAARTSCVPEVVVEGESALLAEPFDLLEFERHIRRLGDDEEVRRQFGSLGRDRALGVYSWDDIAAKYIRTLESAIDSSVPLGDAAGQSKG